LPPLSSLPPSQQSPSLVVARRTSLRVGFRGGRQWGAGRSRPDMKNPGDLVEVSGIFHIRVAPD